MSHEVCIFVLCNCLQGSVHHCSHQSCNSTNQRWWSRDAHCLSFRLATSCLTKTFCLGCCHPHHLFYGRALQPLTNSVFGVAKHQEACWCVTRAQIVRVWLYMQLLHASRQGWMGMLAALPLWTANKRMLLTAALALTGLTRTWTGEKRMQWNLTLKHAAKYKARVAVTCFMHWKAMSARSIRRMPGNTGWQSPS